MRQMTVVTLALASGCTQPLHQAAATPSSPPAERQCFNVAMVQGYRAVDRDTLRLDMGPGQAYEVDLSGPRCDAIDWAQRVALISYPSSWLCVGATPGQGEIQFRDQTSQELTTCHIDAVRAAPAEG